MKRLILILISIPFVLQISAQNGLNTFENITNTIVFQSITNKYVLVVEQKTSTVFCTNEAAKEYYSPLYNVVESQHFDDYYSLDKLIYDSDYYWRKEVYDNIDFDFFPSLKNKENPVLIRMYDRDMVPFMEFKHSPDLQNKNDFELEWFFTGKNIHYLWKFTDSIPTEIIELKHHNITEKFLNVVHDGRISETQRLDLNFSNHKRINYEYDDNLIVKKEVVQRKESGKYKTKYSFAVEPDPVSKTPKLVKYNSKGKEIQKLEYVTDGSGNLMRITKKSGGSEFPQTIDFKYDDNNRIKEKTYNKYAPNVKTVSYEYCSNGMVKSISINWNYINSDGNTRVDFYYTEDLKPFMVQYKSIDEDLKEFIITELVFNYNESGDISNLREYHKTDLDPLVSLITFEYFEIMAD